MAYIKFIKPGEPSRKKGYIASGTARKRWKILSIIEGLIIIGLLIKVIHG